MAIKRICVFRLFSRIPVEGDNNDLFRAEETCTQRGIRFRLVGGEGSHGRHWGHATYVVSDLLEARRCLHRAASFRQRTRSAFLPTRATVGASGCFPWHRLLTRRLADAFSEHEIAENSGAFSPSSQLSEQSPVAARPTRPWRQFLPRLHPGRNASGDSSRRQVRSGSSGRDVARCRPCGTTFHSDPRRNPQLAIPLVVPLDGALLCGLAPFRRLEGI